MSHINDLAQNKMSDTIQQSTTEADRDSQIQARVVGQPSEPIEVEGHDVSTEDIVYPTGPKLWLCMTSVCITCFLNGLDLTIVAVTVPSLTNEFKTISDIGWYSAAYGLTVSAFGFFFGKLYTVFSIKSIFLFGIITFEIGSLLCTCAPSSKALIAGRAIAGLGSSAVNGGIVKILRHSFPMSKMAIFGGIVWCCQSLGLVCAPVIGGALIDGFSWRACFGINIPLGVICIALTAYSFQDPYINPDTALPLAEKVKRVSILDTLLVVPAITALLLALQWAGVKYEWKDPRIIALFVVFGALAIPFAYFQYRQGENATLPPRILKNRSILAAMWYSGCCNGILAMTEYYISIYFQGVRGFTAAKSGLLGLPMIGAFGIAFAVGSVGTTKIGYYFPFMYATSILAPIASGLLTTINLDESVVKPCALLGFLGFAIGLGQQGPMLAVQTVLSPKDVSIGNAIILFGAGMGSALWISASATLFQDRLAVEVGKYSPTTNVTALDSIGLSDIRGYIGRDNLRDVLFGYDNAVVQTLYMPLALGVLTIIGSATIERRSIKEKST